MKNENARQVRSIDEGENQRLEAEEVVTQKKRLPQKLFQFRERLRHEPSKERVLHSYNYEYEYYRQFERYDMVQKEFKYMGGRDLEWRTAWLDLITERALLMEYWEWARGERLKWRPERHRRGEYVLSGAHG